MKDKEHKDKRMQRRFIKDKEHKEGRAQRMKYAREKG